MSRDTQRPAKPRIDLLREGPCRGYWRCRSMAREWHPGACFGESPVEAYRLWLIWQAHVKTRPFGSLELSE